MKKHSFYNIKNLIIPCLVFSVVTGVLSALIITAFQLSAEYIIHLSVRIYGAVRANPMWLPLLLFGTAAVGLVLSLILSVFKACRGGGIPTSVAAIRGIVSFNWLTGVLVLPFAALLSLLCGIPLGTEGPCVQMGTGIGDGVVRTLGGKKHIGWRRYIMTGGAAAGFSMVTGAPITAVIFSMEELHKHFSPLLFSVASLSVLVSRVTAGLLASFGISSAGLFHIEGMGALPLSLFFLPPAVGLLCGGGSVLFAKIYDRINKLIRVKLSRLSVKVKVPVIFACVALIGFFVAEILGTGHSLVEMLFERGLLWYSLIIVFLVRVILMMMSNTSGVTGGIFLPTLAFGALLGSLCAEIFIALGVIGTEYYVLLVVLGMVSFLGATSRIPITACVLSIESFGGAGNALPIIIAVTVAFLIAEISGTKDLTDIVVENKEHSIHKGRTAHNVEVPLTVCEGSFVVDKELGDILWPVSCVVLSVERSADKKHRSTIGVGDVITVYYKTYDPIATAEEFEVLVGDQPDHIDQIMRRV